MEKLRFAHNIRHNKYNMEGNMAKVLVIDDSKTSRKFLEDVIKGAGHDVVGLACDGAQGLELYKEFHPDVVTMDIIMPVMDGKDAVSAIIKEDPEARIIMVTSAGQKDNVIDCLKRGAADFIQKPYDSSLLLNTIEKVMEE